MVSELIEAYTCNKVVHLIVKGELYLGEAGVYIVFFNTKRSTSLLCTLAPSGVWIYLHKPGLHVFLD